MKSSRAIVAQALREAGCRIVVDKHDTADPLEYTWFIVADHEGLRFSVEGFYGDVSTRRPA